MKPDRNTPCPCGSTLKTKKCCHKGHRWLKEPTILTSRQPKSGYQHSRCYANTLNDCDSQITREHYLSNNLLADFEENNTVKIFGLPWQEKQSYDLLSRKSMVSKILCKHHNESLSPFDVEIAYFYRAIVEFDEDFNSEQPSTDFKIIAGENLERWMLKTVCAFIASQQFHRNGEKSKLELKSIYNEILYEGRPFPSGWGLYFDMEGNKKTQKYRSFSFVPFEANGELKGISFYIANFKFNFLLGEPDAPDYWGIYHPSSIVFKQGEIKKELLITWRDDNYHKSTILFNRIGTKQGEPANWEEWMKK
ncbi:SEC-C domain-containing protein [Fulvivirga sp. 29W222]|uniref:SEC-C domain-containing protein n=1 Tax=Fulvivirga marina TaxID=2494733 RepID=A0A937G390_9BACT|nr:SEC-C domain-containing protein [Fulvivirga marina]MBL6447626.1 SEC-C domain-containing protein [Fulvivirga marina]